MNALTTDTTSIPPAQIPTVLPGEDATTDAVNAAAPADNTTATPMPAAPATFDRIDAMFAELDQIDNLIAQEEPPRARTSADVMQTGHRTSDSLRGFAIPAGFKLSVVIPVYNEEPTLAELGGRVREVPMPLEIIVVDDCSTDGTRGILRELSQYADVKIVYKDHNEGKGAALRTGFKYVTGDVVVVQDADLEYDPRDIPKLVQPIVEDRADVVYGSRFRGKRPADSTFVHRLGNGLLTAASNLTTGLSLSDMETCYKVFRRNSLRGLDLKQDRFGFEPEITAKIARRGCRVEERPIGYRARGWEEGKKIGIQDGINALYCIVRYAWFD